MTFISPYPKKRWVAHGGSWERYEDLLIGDREGLLALRQAIDDALANGESRLQDCGTEFKAVRVVDTYPDEERPSIPVRARISAMIVLALMLFLLICCIYGFIRLLALVK